MTRFGAFRSSATTLELPPGLASARAELVGDDAIPNAAWTIVQWGSPVLSGVSHSNGSFTPQYAGVYLVSFFATWVDAVTDDDKGARNISIRKNGTVQARADLEADNRSDDTLMSPVYCNGTTDVLTVEVFQNSGRTQWLRGGNSGDRARVRIAAWGFA